TTESRALIQHLTLQWFGHTSHSVSSHGHHRGILGKLARVYLVQSVGRGVMIVEIRSIVLNRSRGRDTGRIQRRDIGAFGVQRSPYDVRSEALKPPANRLQLLNRLFACMK